MADDRWLLATFQPASLFSLRSSFATSKGGKTLLVPTPYSIRMALIDACFRRYAPDEAEAKAHETFHLLKSCGIRFRPPEHAVVENTFIKILDHARDGTEPFRQTIAYREFVAFVGELTVAFSVADDAQSARLIELLPYIQHLGKRGSFMQFLGCGISDDGCPPGFSIDIESSELYDPREYALLQLLDDFGTELIKAKDGFDRISTYGSGDIRLGKHRVLRHVALPYVRHRAGRSSTWYRRSN